MVVISPVINESTKKIHCPICGARLCDTNKSENISYTNTLYCSLGIIVKCHKCGRKFKINIIN